MQFLKRLSLLISNIQDFSPLLCKGHLVTFLWLKRERGEAESWEGKEKKAEGSINAEVRRPFKSVVQGTPSAVTKQQAKQANGIFLTIIQNSCLGQRDRHS